MPNLEEAIRERAYHLWIADGQPEGQADMYWLNAQREILTTSVESLGSNAPAAVPTYTGLVATKSAKKAKVARSGKSKTRAAPVLWNRFVNPPCPLGNGGEPRYAAKPNPATSSKSCSKSGPGARHMVLYVSKKGSQTSRPFPLSRAHIAHRPQPAAPRSCECRAAFANELVTAPPPASIPASV